MITKEYILNLQQELNKKGDPSVKLWWENYVKGSAPFIGVKMPVIRSILHEWYKNNIEGKTDNQEQVELALELFNERYSEEKLAGVLFLQEILIPGKLISCNNLDRLAGLFTSNLIYDWNICDKVLGPLIKENGTDCARKISQWRYSENLWQARASVVAFVNLAGNKDFYPEILESCQLLI